MPPQQSRTHPPNTGRATFFHPSLFLFLALFLLSPFPSRADGEPINPTGWSEPDSRPATDPAADLWDAASATAVVYNSDVPESVEIAQFYAKKRGIPDSHLIGIPCAAAETIAREEFDTTIRIPLIAQLKERGLWTPNSKVAPEGETGDPETSEHSIRILALIYGVPIRVDRTLDADGKRRTAPAGKGDEASVDAELALLGADELKIEGPLKNPYYEKDIRFPDLDAPPMFLVSRLDGPSPEVVKRMITDSIATEENGLHGFAYFDLAQKGAGYEAGDLWITGSEILFRNYGFPTVVDPYSERFPDYYPMGETAVYLGWYTSHLDGPFLNPDFKFAPGAIACHLHSFSGQDLRQSTRHWTGPLLRRGAAASLGNVWEPYLALTVHFDLLTDRLLKGYTFAEASWMATPALSWMNIAVGDPLYRPFKSLLVGPPIGEVPPAESDFALFRRLALSHAGNTEAALKRALTDAAAERKSGTLLECAGLVSAAAGRHSEAADLFEHAIATYAAQPDRIRGLLHIADMRRRAGDLPSAKATLEATLKNFPDAKAAQTLLDHLTKVAP